jgi:hypothetical protein
MGDEEKLSFAELMRMLIDAEEMDCYSDDEYAAIVGKVGDKVDALRVVISKLEAESDRLKCIKTEFEKAQRTVEKNLDRLKKFIVETMVKSELRVVNGEKFKLQIVERDSIDWKLPEITSDIVIKLGSKYPGVIRVTREWNKNDLKSVIEKQNPDEIKEFYTLSKTRFLKLGVSK